MIDVDVPDRLNTALESAGAEHLVIGQLLVRGFQAFRAQANQPGYDIVVVHAETNRSIKVQVKSRAASDAGGFKVKNWNFDLLVMVRLNLGRRSVLGAGERQAPQPTFHVVAREELADLEAQGAVRFRLDAIPACEDAWEAIHDAFQRVARRSNEGFYLDEFGRRRDAELYE